MNVKSRTVLTTHTPWLLLGMLTISCLNLRASDNVIPLQGTWRFELDRGNAGIQERWCERELKGKARLPGVLSAQGIGDDVSLDTKWTGGIMDAKWFQNPIYSPWTNRENFKFPFWLQPEKYYAGPAWFQRNLEIPAGWAAKRVALVLERPHWQTRVWLDGKEIGFSNGLSTPHRYELGVGLAAGRHVLTVRVDNSRVVEIGENTHAITDHTQGNWNGIAGQIRLEASDPVWIEDLQVYPELKTGRVRVRGAVGNLSGKSAGGKLALRVELAGASESAPPCASQEVDVQWQVGGGSFEAELTVPQARSWDEFRPDLYQLRARLSGSREEKLAQFGFRDLSTEGTQFVLNGRKTWFRGTLECSIFPLTGHPSTETSEWTRIIKVAKAHGLNMFRFHSYCPPEAAFIAADRLGFYLQVETCWANMTTTIGDGKPVDQWVYDETERILKEYGNHPSFVLMAHGNEPGGNNANAYLAKYVDHFKAQDPRRLWTSGAGWPQLKENQYHLTPDPRIMGWGEGLKSRINAKPPETVTDYREYIQKRSIPVISHEIGEWCVYPNFEEIPKYKGYLKPKNFEIFRDTLKAHHMGDLGRSFLLASGKLQTLCYKEEIESALRTPGMGGFHLLDLHDFPGQGTALVGVLDPFWEYKGYVTDREFSRFCNSTVPLARLQKRVFTVSEELRADLEVAHFGPEVLRSTVLAWKVVSDDGCVVVQGKLVPTDIQIGNGVRIGSLAIPLCQMRAPARYKLVTGLQGTRFENDWDFWVYPDKANTEIPGDVKVVDHFDDEVVNLLNRGERVLLTIPAAKVNGDARGKVGLGFSSIFWNTAWTGGQTPHTLGILCNPKHPALAQFPTESHSNWQWWYLVSRAGAMVLDDMPENLRPVVQVIDDWVTNRKLGILVEARVGKGRLLICSVDLRKEAQENLVARQMLASLLQYAGGNRFKPSVSITPAQVRQLIAEPSSALKAGARVTHSSSAQPGFEAGNVLDGDPATLWHTSWSEPIPAFPHSIELAFEKPVTCKGITVLPRQDDNHNGWIKDYEVLVTAGQDRWELAAKGRFTADSALKSISFKRPEEVRGIRVIALSGHANGSWASIAELGLIK